MPRAVGFGCAMTCHRFLFPADVDAEEVPAIGSRSREMRRSKRKAATSRRTPKKSPANAGLVLVCFSRVLFFQRVDYAWNELPQPHDLTAFGLSKVNPRCSRLSK